MIMNREIKFRAKSKSTNTWLYGDLLRNEQWAKRINSKYLNE